MEERVRAFYDEFSQHLLSDYVHGNPRVEAAIQHSVRWIPAGAKRVLDIGCGIGWSTWEIKRHAPHAFILGIDLSRRATEIAQSLFNEHNLRFVAHDIAAWSPLFEPTFDAIVMCDVYEHIPNNLRNNAHQVLRKALGHEGRIILTFPSLFHQEFLRVHHPERLQPVEENVRIEDIANLAQDIQGHVIYYSHVDIWHANDYIHAVIERSPKYVEIKHIASNSPAIKLESRKQRTKRVISHLKLREMGHGVPMPGVKRDIVCIACPDKDAYSETFIRAHIERLPAKVRMVYGDFFPLFTENDRPLLPWFQYGANLAFAKLMGLDPRRFHNAVLSRYPKSLRNAALCHYLKREHAQAVLAEYGPTGVAIMSVCKRANLPLIVHFHGYDAYKFETLQGAGRSYPELFQNAAAIIAVSRDMESQLLSLGSPPEKLFYIPYGVDTSLFAKADPGHAPPVFVAVGRFVDKKAPYLTLLAFQRVVKDGNEARLIMIGNGPLVDSCKQLSRALCIDNAVDFRGPCSHLEVAAIMRGCRAFVQHSMRAISGDSEGTPVAILEAGATGLPVVATRHAGIKDVIIEGETGLLVDEGDIDGMAEYMIRLSRDPALAARLGSRARERVHAEFSMEKSIANLWDIIERAIQKK